MTAKRKVLALKLMPAGGVIGCALFVVLSLSLVVLGITSSEYLLVALFIPGVIFFGLPFYMLVDPERVARQRQEQAIEVAENQQAAIATNDNDIVAIVTLIIAGMIALVLLWWFIGSVASLPVGVLLTIIILLLLFRR